MIDFLKNHYMDLFAALGALVALLKVVAPLTPTDVDNKVLKGLSWVVSKLSGVVTPKVKQ